MEALTALRESALRSQVATWRGAGPSCTPDRQQPSIQHTGQPGSDNKEQRYHIRARPSARAATATPSANQIGLFKPEVDLIMKVNSLEQQLGRSQDEAKLLRRQLNESDRRLQEEQQRNRSLKGV